MDFPWLVNPVQVNPLPLKMIAKMYAPTSGNIEYKGRDIQEIKSRSDLMHYREGIQMVGKIRLARFKPDSYHFPPYCRPF